MPIRHRGVVPASVALVLASLCAISARPAGATVYSNVNTETAFRTAWADPTATEIDLTADIALTCIAGRPARASAVPLKLEGNGHTLTQTCAGNGALGQTGTGAITLDNVTVTGANTTFVGGGIHVSGGAALTVTSSTITKNTGATAGGIVAEGALTITNSSVTDNGNGGIFASGPTEIADSTISGNTSSSDGGGIAATNSLEINNSTITDNSTGAKGGGISASASLTVTASTINGNTSTLNGGGIDSADAPVTITNSTITDNTGGPAGDPLVAGGGGIHGFGLVKLVYATVVGNTLTLSRFPSGGGANVDLNEAGTLTSFGSVVALGQGGPNCANVAPPTSAGYNFSDDSSCSFTGAGDRQSAGNPDLAPLAGNGGPTQTRLPQTGSPLIDGVPVASCQADGATGVTTDQRGVTRPQGAGCDIGAVEVAVAATPLAVVPNFTG